MSKRSVLRALLLLAGVVAALASVDAPPVVQRFSMPPNGKRLLRVSVASSDKPEAVAPHLNFTLQNAPDAGVGQLVGFVSATRPSQAAIDAIQSGTFGVGQDAGEVGIIGFSLPMPFSRN